MSLSLKCETVARAGLGEPAKREGAELLYRCPHPDGHKNSDAHPSLKINPKKNVWTCFPCGASGTAWKLAAFLAGCDPGDKERVTAWLKDKGLLNGPKRKAKADGRGPCVAKYLYTDAEGKPLVERRLKGYDRDQFAEAWGLYLLPDSPTSSSVPDFNRDTVTTRINTGENGDFQSVTLGRCHASEKAVSVNRDAGCHGVTGPNQGEGEKQSSGDLDTGLSGADTVEI